MSQQAAVAANSILIRPTRNAAEQSPEAFYDLLASVRSFEKLTLAKVGKVIGEDQGNVEQNITRKIARRTFSAEARLAVLDHIFDEEQLLLGKQRDALRAIPDAFYFAFLNQFGVNETSQDKARAWIVGTYKLWRYSVEHDGEFVLGRLDISEDPKTRAVRVEMIQPKQERDGVRGSREHLTGYLFRVSHMFLFIVRDLTSNDLRVALFPRFKLDNVGSGVNEKSVFKGVQKHVVHLDGFGLGVDGNNGFFSPVHLSLVDDAEELAALHASLDVVPEGDPRIPARIAKKLDRNGRLRRL